VAVASLDKLISLLQDQQRLQAAAGTEVGYESALRSLDFDALISRLIANKVLPDRPGYYEKYVSKIRAEGSKAFISGRLDGVRGFRTSVQGFNQSLVDSRSVAQGGKLIPSIDDRKIPAVLTAQQIFKMMMDDLATDCMVYAFISKEARGTLGWK
jgi:hypothetical protein